MFFNAGIIEGGGTPDWEQLLGQSKPLLLMKDDCSEILNGMLYNKEDIDQFNYGAGGTNYQVELVSIFKNITVAIYDAAIGSKTFLSL